MNKLIMDLSQVEKADVGVIKLGLSAIQFCTELSVRHSLIGSEAVCHECKSCEAPKTKDWRFVTTIEEAALALEGKQLAAA